MPNKMFQPKPALLWGILNQRFTVRSLIETVMLAGLVMTGFGGSANASALPGTLAGKRAALLTVREQSKMFLSLSSEAVKFEEQDAQAAPSAAADTHPTAGLPKITYEDGLLTISAENCLLSDVLSELHSVMGADVDLPAGASGQRVWVKVGPGPARKVLGELLNGTGLDYIIQGSPTDANGIRSVSLTLRSKSFPSTPETSFEPAERIAARRGPRMDRPATGASEQENSASPAAAADALPVAPPAESSVNGDRAPSAAVPTNGERVPSAASAAVSTYVPQVSSNDVPSNVSESVAHPAPPASLSQDQVTQQLQTMYEQRRQLQQAQQAPPQSH